MGNDGLWVSPQQFLSNALLSSHFSLLRPESSPWTTVLHELLLYWSFLWAAVLQDSPAPAAWLLHRFLGSLCSGTWSTYLFSDLGVHKAVDLRIFPHFSLSIWYFLSLTEQTLPDVHTFGCWACPCPVVVPLDPSGNGCAGHEVAPALPHTGASQNLPAPWHLHPIQQCRFEFSLKQLELVDRCSI